MQNFKALFREELSSGMAYQPNSIYSMVGPKKRVAKGLCSIFVPQSTRGSNEDLEVHYAANQLSLDTLKIPT